MERELFISNELAILAKLKGFYEPCMKGVKNGEVLTGCGFSFTNHGTTHDYTLPLYQQIVNWFREKHNINIMYGVCGSRTKVLGYKWWVQVGMNDDCYQTKMIKDYYVGMTEAIEEAFKLI